MKSNQHSVPSFFDNLFGIEAIDKFGNKLDRGGSRVDARANGPGVSACQAEDKGDGTYIISFSSAVVGETRVTVRLDHVADECPHCR